LNIFSDSLASDNHLIEMKVIYEDSFSIKYGFNVGLLFRKKTLNEPSVVLFETNETGFKDLVDVRYPSEPQ
jgi:hypothetical protein